MSTQPRPSSFRWSARQAHSSSQEVSEICGYHTFIYLPEGGPKKNLRTKRFTKTLLNCCKHHLYQVSKCWAVNPRSPGLSGGFTDVGGIQSEEKNRALRVSQSYHMGWQWEREGTTEQRHPQVKETLLPRPQHSQGNTRHGKMRHSRQRQFGLFSWYLKQSLLCITWQNQTGQQKLQKSRQLKVINIVQRKKRQTLKKWRNKTMMVPGAHSEPCKNTKLFRTLSSNELQVRKWRDRVTELQSSRQEKHSRYAIWIPGRKIGNHRMRAQWS